MPAFGRAAAPKARSSKRSAEELASPLLATPSDEGTWQPRAFSFPGCQAQRRESGSTTSLFLVVRPDTPVLASAGPGKCEWSCLNQAQRRFAVHGLSEQNGTPGFL